MKLPLLMAMASAVLLLVPITVGASQWDSPQADSMSGRALMEQNANESAQATTDMSFSEPAQRAQTVRNVSYGGVATGQSEAGGRRSARCSAGAQCRIYFGQ